MLRNAGLVLLATVLVELTFPAELAFGFWRKRFWLRTRTLLWLCPPTQPVVLVIYAQAKQVF